MLQRLPSAGTQSITRAFAKLALKIAAQLALCREIHEICAVFDKFCQLFRPLGITTIQCLAVFTEHRQLKQASRGPSTTSLRLLEFQPSTTLRQREPALVQASVQHRTQ